MAETKPSFSMRGYLLRVAGSVVILGVLFWFLPIEAVVEAFKRLTVWDFLLVLLGFLSLHLVAAFKWLIVLDFRISPFIALRAHFAGLAANLCLPGAISGDAVRGGLAYAAMGEGATVVAAGATDRLIDFTALMILSILGLTFSLTHGGSVSLTLEVLLIFAALVTCAVVGLQVMPWLWNRFPWLPAQDFVRKLTKAFGALAKRRGPMALALVLSLCIQLGLIFLSYRLAVAAGADIAPGLWLFAWPLAKLIAVLPVSLNGLGVREAALAGILGRVGGDAAVIVAAGLAWQAVIFAAGGLGALILVLTPGAKKPFGMGRDATGDTE